MSTHLERVKIVCETIQSLAVSVAVLVGGSWALYKYVILESPTGQVALDELKRICASRGSLDIKIEATDETLQLFGKVLIKNIGTRVVALDMREDSPITVSQLAFPEPGKIEAATTFLVKFPYQFGQAPIAGLDFFSILPGRTVELHFATAVKNPGAYLISFMGGRRNVDPDEEICRKSSSGAEHQDLVWAATSIHYIKK